ncbi:MAG: hypothetical protein JW801_19470 [Bacteroidales bacterium]|nr:hypothetical protein [Bacteroidales bacterium]
MELYKHFLFISLIYILFSIEARSQSYDWSPLNREIVITAGDSTVNAYVSIMTSASPKLKDNLVYHWYDQDMVRTNMGGYSGVLLDGGYTVYDKDDNLITQGNFKKGLQDGLWKFWNPDGQLKKILTYKKGVLHGEYKIWDSQGTIVESGRYRHGERKTANTDAEE